MMAATGPVPASVDHAFDRRGRHHIAANAAATGGAHRATAVGFVSAFSRLPVHPVKMKANNRAMIRISAILFCRFSKYGIRREENAITVIGGWRDPRKAVSVWASTKLKRQQAFSPCGLRVKIECL
jgi:hypothetical protein